jgi:molybdopterin-guanine dinucleotide biosynthesis protein B
MAFPSFLLAGFYDECLRAAPEIVKNATGKTIKFCVLTTYNLTMHPMKVFGISGWSGSGKTTLIEHLLPLWRAKGLTVSLIKHTHHGFDIDRPGKDSWRFREAGASEVMLAGAQRWALMHELREGPEPVLADLLSHLAPCDLVIVEGFKSAGLPKIEVHRPSLGKAFFHAEFPAVVALASDVALDIALPVLDLNDPPAIADWILDYCGLI